MDGAKKIVRDQLAKEGFADVEQTINVEILNKRY